MFFSVLDTDSIHLGLGKETLDECILDKCKNEWREYSSNFMDKSELLAGQLIKEFSAKRGYYYGEKMYELDFNEKNEKNLDLIVKKSKSIPFHFQDQLNHSATKIKIIRFNIKTFGVVTERFLYNLHNVNNPLKRYFYDSINSRALEIS